MQTGTVVGLLVGGAVLILATAPRAAASATGQPATAAPGGALNPLNWPSMLQQQAAQQPIQQNPAYNYAPQAALPQQQPSYNANPVVTPAGGLQQASYNPAQTYNNPLVYSSPAGGGVQPLETQYVNSPAESVAAYSAVYNAGNPFAGGYQSTAYGMGGGGGMIQAANTTPGYYSQSPGGMWA